MSYRDPEKQKAYHKSWRDANPEKLKDYRRSPSHKVSQSEAHKKMWKEIKSDPERKAKWLAYHRQADAKRYTKVKNLVFDHYGRICACCTESNEKFLTIDHVNNDGADHRRKIRGKFKNFYQWLVKNDYPDGFQTLCHNCNIGKWRNKGVCPHKEASLAETPAFVSEGSL